MAPLQILYNQPAISAVWLSLGNHYILRWPFR